MQLGAHPLLELGYKVLLEYNIASSGASGDPFTGVQVLRLKRLILLHEGSGEPPKSLNEVKLPHPPCAAPWSTLWLQAEKGPNK